LIYACHLCMSAMLIFSVSRESDIKQLHATMDWWP